LAPNAIHKQAASAVTKRTIINYQYDLIM